MENEILKVLREVILHLRLHCEGPITEEHSMEVMEECADRLETKVLNQIESEYEDNRSDEERAIAYDDIMSNPFPAEI